MFKRFLVIGAVVLAACGTGSSGSNASTDQGGGGQPGFGPNVPTIPVGALVTPNPTIVKVVLNTTQTVYSLVCSGYDENGDCIPQGCPCATGQICAPTGECVSPRDVPTILYVKNIDYNAAGNYSFPVPCDTTRGYIAEVYVTTTPKAAAGARTIDEWYFSPSFTMQAVGTSCSPSGLTWPAPNLGAPVVHNPLTPVYVAGLDPRFNTFQLTVTGLSSPWATGGGTSWTVAYPDQTPGTTYRGATATLPAPPAVSAGTPLGLTTTFSLNSQRLTSDETVTGSVHPWIFTATGVPGPTPVGIGTVPPP
jgi:hypothetical protein